MNFAAECTSVAVPPEMPTSPGSQGWLRNYTFRSMLRRPATQATAAQTEATGVSRSRKPRGLQAWSKRLGKRVVQKSDGRYLIYYDKA